MGNPPPPLRGNPPPLFHEIGQRDLGPGMDDVIRAKNLARRRRENFALFKGFSGRKRSKKPKIFAPAARSNPPKSPK